ncbi:MAG: serine/threonine protein kinase [Pirellula sp.]
MQEESEFLGPYRVVREIGRGGMGVVYEARHERSQETVACKVIADYLANDPQMRRRFDSEVTTLLRLKHPNVVRIIGFGESKGRLFYAMEYVDGENLHQRLCREKRVDWQTMLDWAIDVCGALKQAHDFGVIHRDLKTANLMIAKSGQIKLTDFGIGQIFDSRGNTNPNAVIGTADFMAPEQAEGKEVSVRSDLYALGAICYTALCGKTPFTGKNTPEILFNLRYGTYTPVRKLAPKVPEDFAELIDELLSRSPEDRPPTAFVVGNRLKAMRVGLTKFGEPKPPTPAPFADKQPVPRDSRRPNSRPTDEPTDDLTSIDMSNYPSIADLSSPHRDGLTRLGQRDPGESKDNAADDSSSELIGNDSSNSIAGPNEVTRALGASGGDSSSDAADKERNTYTIATDEERYRAIHGRNPNALDWNWQQIASVAGLLSLIGLCIGAAIWMSRPPSADALWSEISASVLSGDDDQLLEVSEAAERFVRLYPDHPQTATVQKALGDVQTLHALRQLERRSANRGFDRLDAIEQPLLVALRLARIDPSAAAKRLDALLAVYRDAEGLSNQQQSNLAAAQLARGRLEESSTQPEIPQILRQLEGRMVWAEANLDVERRQQFYENILLLYRDLPWAAPAMETATARHKALSVPAPATAKPPLVDSDAGDGAVD